MKARLYALGGLILAAVAAVLRIMHLSNARDKAERQARVYKGRAEQAVKVREIDHQIEEQAVVRRAEVVKEIEDEGIASNLGSDSDNW